MDNYTPDYIPKELIKRLQQEPLTRLHIHSGVEQKSDPINTYTVKNGFRITEPINSPDILAVGCSQTWGVGVPDHALWPAVLANKTSKSYFNLGVPGVSIMHLVLLAINYIEKYGNPEYVVALWPDIRRIFIPIDAEVNSVSIDTWSEDIGENPRIDIQDVHFPHNRFGSNDYIAKFSKKPHVIHEVISYSIPFVYSIHYLRFFEEYCKLKNIKLISSTWDGETAVLVKELGLDSFYFLDWLHYDKAPNHEIYISDCHPSMEDVYGMNWFRGADHTDENMGHIGIHEHLDYAEMFERVIRDGK